ncbi:MAG: WGR domain-containing protein [Gammaproteobacteria bacterium]|nr:WGR domain-containing protein [Gammaproteobacteria bacterium]
MRIYMQTPPTSDQPPRFYQIYLERDLLAGWIVTKEWGHVGASGRVKLEHYDDHDTAVAALEETRDAQCKRGYRVVFVQGQNEPR